MRKNAWMGLQQPQRKSPIPEGTRFFADSAFKRAKKVRQWARYIGKARK